MENIENLILYENECTGVDFKLFQYRKDQHVAFLKDVLAMANADYEGSRFIIIGVKPAAERQMPGIKENIIDEAIYQQIVDNNIEPKISFSYTPYQIEDKIFGIFKITNVLDQPYLMKKAYGGELQAGDTFIRIGTSQRKLLLADYNRIYSKINNSINFNGKIEILPNVNGVSSKSLAPILDLKFPSAESSKKIKKILEERKRYVSSQFANLNLAGLSPFGNSSYEQRSTEVLRQNLLNIKQTYKKDDLNYLYEIRGHKLNFGILNTGSSYLEDATCIIEIELKPGFTIANKIHEKQISQDPFAPRIFPQPSWESLNYPILKFSSSVVTIEQSIGDLKHNIPCNLFPVPLRVAVSEELRANNIEVKFSIHGRNLKIPIIHQIIFSILD